ncbi:biotin--[acetyl-CoA-carboxylase] ligase [Deinococcus irradiatisoli]|uniref:biotin--[biotin carboxyl-carrier protein] ligase n=1 Tax=Deinococcus irradiatisoli TaxID=2202254 RepID=A0A2Z3JMJ8_9DEIO|nr:biotin--[acetyl-CoA-carboxylase] ligase [Deinococcus irradiatisoli]
MIARFIEALDSAQPEAALAQPLSLSPGELQTLALEARQLGVPVESSGAGYALAAGTPTPAALRAEGFTGAYRYLAQVGSTQDEVRRWADDPHDPAPPGAAVLAETQLAGRGRRGRVWQPTPGQALTFSVLLPAEVLSPDSLPLLPLAAGVALREACLGRLPPGTAAPGLKWPNDLLAPDGRKLAGILLEAELRGGSVRRAVLGIGLNVTSAPPGAACLADLAPGYPLNRAALLASLLRSLDLWCRVPGSEVRQAWQAANVTLGRDVQVQAAGGLVQGRACALTEWGELQVLTPQGQTLTIGAGDVELVGALR